MRLSRPAAWFVLLALCGCPVFCCTATDECCDDCGGTQPLCDSHGCFCTGAPRPELADHHLPVDCPTALIAFVLATPAESLRDAVLHEHLTPDDPLFLGAPPLLI